MNRNLLIWPVVVAGTLATSQGLGQSSDEPAVRLIELPARTGLNQFRVSARMGYNISAHLDNVGLPAGQGFPQPPPPKDPSQHFQSATGTTYQDGYVGIDESGNAPARPDPGPHFLLGLRAAGPDRRPQPRRHRRHSFTEPFRFGHTASGFQERSPSRYRGQLRTAVWPTRRRLDLWD